MRNFILIGIISVALCACAKTTATVNTVTTDTNNSIAALEESLTTAEKLATWYNTLPDCASPGATKFCSTATIRNEVTNADTKAYNAVETAKKDSTQVEEALSAIEELSVLVPFTD